MKPPPAPLPLPLDEEDSLESSATHLVPPAEARRCAQRVGGRSERVVREVLHATSEELSRVGYARLRVEDVAAAAGVNKTTIYRRWPTKADLVGAMLRTLKGPLQDAPDLGSVRLDLMALAHESVERASTCEGRTLHRMITLEIDHPEVAALARALRTDYLAPWVFVVERAMTRGELPIESDGQLIVEMVMGPVFGKLRFREEVDDAFLEAVVRWRSDEDETSATAAQ
jgi:AcrR family transcriptional regulator